jgi:hypothetical protein
VNGLCEWAATYSGAPDNSLTSAVREVAAAMVHPCRIRSPQEDYMRLISIVFAALVMATPALASDRNLCPQSGTWMPIDQAIARAEALGYAVKEAKRSKGCWKIEGYDRNGAEIEILLDPASGEPVKRRSWRAPASR